MKPWEVKKTREKMKKMSPQKSIEMFLELYAAGREVLRATFKGSEQKLIKKLEKHGL